MGGALSIELSGGPAVPMVFGRLDAKNYDRLSYDSGDPNNREHFERYKAV